MLRLWNWRLSESQKRWLSVNPRISFQAAVIGALFGGYSHVLLDSVMHSDMQPFAPFSEQNGLLRIISIERLHEVCVFAGILGATGLSVQLMRRKKRLERAQRSA